MVSLKSLKSDEQRANELLARPEIQQRIKEIEEGVRLLGLSKQEYGLICNMWEIPELMKFVRDLLDEAKREALDEVSQLHDGEGKFDRQ
jgi:hypothetical protein